MSKLLREDLRKGFIVKVFHRGYTIEVYEVKDKDKFSHCVSYIKLPQSKEVKDEALGFPTYKKDEVIGFDTGHNWPGMKQGQNIRNHVASAIRQGQVAADKYADFFGDGNVWSYDEE